MHFALGNPAPLDAGAPMDGPQITEGNLPDEWSAEQWFAAITDPQGIWRAHSGASRPSWIECSDLDFAQRLSDHYGSPIGRRGE